MADSPDLRPIVISGPSGVGKGTLIQKLFDTHPGTFGLTVSHTTREPRPGEVEGVAYFFVSRSEFSSLCSQGALVEYACFSGNYYGTSKQAIENQASKGLIVVLDIEMQGIKQMKANPNFNARYVFIKPPSFEALETRLRGRRTENEENIQERLSQAHIEFDYADLPATLIRSLSTMVLKRHIRSLRSFVFGSPSRDHT
ncbi:hypothetical protein N7468_008838 [Penicillium chermesinum]|uniref:guanylate kinase n=1 Tax=Penicillium chermesinum TaxID=63820 RepID=A0A9W9TEN6_9EURO|nr:uncharacterized protein N7468_008838 [Penicillium chermesinum]KAJ5219634.1 hypothetical protein N7468_008838 [Penicillium chermesinum]